MRIAVEGLIGVGKSTFVSEFADITGVKPLFESVDDNPFLEPFFKTLSVGHIPYNLTFFTVGITTIRQRVILSLIALFTETSALLICSTKTAL